MSRRFSIRPAASSARSERATATGVEEGEVLVRLDDTVTQANLAVVSKEQDALLARRARLQAERDGAETITVPAELTTRSGDPAVREIVEGEQRLFDMRRAARDGQKAQLGERVAQLEKEIEGTISQQDANLREIALAQQELGGVRQLWEKKLVPMTRLVAMEREIARLEGLRGQLTGAIAKLRGAVSEIRLQIVQIDRDLGTEVGQQIRDAERQIGELVERRVAAEDLLRRVDIRAPQSGVVHQSTVHTVGGVIAGDGQPIMLIVPETDELAVEARVRPQDIDQIAVGEHAKLRFSAFNQRTTPQIAGAVSHVSADVSRDPVTGVPFYTVRVAIPKDEVASLGDVKLVPGMPVETFVETGARSVASYLMKPFADQFARSFRAS
jgi:HlyD family secretion protein